MLKTEIKTAIDRYSHVVGETHHRFKPVGQWAALEPRGSSRSARYLLAIEVRSDSDQLTQLPLEADAVEESALLEERVFDPPDEIFDAAFPSAGRGGSGPARERLQRKRKEPHDFPEGRRWH